MSLSISQSARRSGESVEHVELLIIGAGLSGIAAACHFHKSFPDKSYAILEARAAVGGAAKTALIGGLTAEQIGEIERSLGRLEAALRARSATAR